MGHNMRITDLLDKNSISLNAAPADKKETLDLAVELMAKSARRTPTGRASWRCWPLYDKSAPPSGFPESGALFQYSIPCRAAMPFW